MGIGGQIGGGAETGTGGDPGAGGGGARAGSPYGVGGTHVAGSICPGPTVCMNSGLSRMFHNSLRKSNCPVLPKFAFGTGATYGCVVGGAGGATGPTGATAAGLPAGASPAGM